MKLLLEGVRNTHLAQTGFSYRSDNDRIVIRPSLKSNAPAFDELPIKNCSYPTLSLPKMFNNNNNLKVSSDRQCKIKKIITNTLC